MSLQIPEFFLKWMPSETERWLIGENSIDCKNCLMVHKENPLGEKPYLKSLKCCTFHPFTANFLIGGVLREGGEGATIIESIIESKGFLLPIGLVASDSYQYSFRKMGKENFGRDSKLLCPFFNRQKENCLIWAFRGSECISYRCSSRFGRQGGKVWQFIRDYLFEIEMVIVQHSLLEKGYSCQELNTQLDMIRVSQFSDSPQPQLYENRLNFLWVHNKGNVIGYFCEVYDWASRLSYLNLVEMGLTPHEEFQFKLLQEIEKIDANA